MAVNPNQVDTYLCVNRNYSKVGVDEEWMCDGKPERNSSGHWESCIYENFEVVLMMIELPAGTIERLIGRKLTPQDEPVLLEAELIKQ